MFASKFNYVSIPPIISLLSVVYLQYIVGGARHSENLFNTHRITAPVSHLIFTAVRTGRHPQMNTNN